MHKAKVGIIGASGYSGMEAIRLLARHPRVEIAFATSERWVDERLDRRIPMAGPASALTFVSAEKAEALSRSCDAVFLATPAELSSELAPALAKTTARVIDLSGAFRLKTKGTAQKAYGFEPDSSLLDQSVYGLCELFRAQVAKASVVANPGCYPTAAALPLAPLVKAQLIQPDSVVINAASGVSGAGRKVNEDTSFMELDGDFRAYRVGKHQHAPEIAQTLSWMLPSGTSPSSVALTFTPHLLPVKRGILCTSVVRMVKGVGPSDIGAALQAAYGSEPFIRLAKTPEEVSLRCVVGTNLCQIGFAVDQDNPDRLILISAIDNLIKGAAGQAIQNLNIQFGFPETDGLL